MLTVPQAIKDLYLTDGINKNFHVHFPNGEYSDLSNDDILQESVRFTESLCSQNVFKFGLAESSVLEFETVGVGNMYGMMIEAGIDIDCFTLSSADIATIEADAGDGELIDDIKTVPVTMEAGTMSTSTGGDSSSTSRIRTKGYIPVEKDTVRMMFTLASATYTYARVFFYNSNKAFLSYVQKSATQSTGRLDFDDTFDVPTGAAYFRAEMTNTAQNIAIGFSSYSYRIPYGTFKVDKCPRNHGAMTHRRITAYTLKEHDWQHFPNLQTTLPHPQIKISTEAFLARTLESAQLVDNVEFGNTNYIDSFVYNSSRNAIYVSVRLQKNGTSLQTDVAKWCKVYNVSTSISDNFAPSFVEMIGATYDYEKHYNFGKRVAKALTDAHFDLTYNSKGKKVYDSNESALKANFPYYFYPCLYYRYVRAGGQSYSSLPTAQKMKTGEMIPLLALGKSAANHYPNAINVPSAFKADETDIWITDAHIVACVDLTGEDDIEYRVNLSTVANNIPPFTMTTDFPTALPTVNRYGLDSYGTMLAINPASTGETQELANVSANLNHQSFNYMGAFSYRDMIDGILETKAQFIKAKRDGGFEVMRLDNTSPQSFYPHQYSEMWWDEYDIDPIGTVKVMFQEDSTSENAEEITISGGSSTYDMTNNEMLKNLPDATVDSVSALLESSFAPYMGAVAFTPADITMRGCPWIEAGDALEIEAEDETIVDTYALRIEYSGVQSLRMYIEAQGGRIYEGAS